MLWERYEEGDKMLKKRGLQLYQKYDQGKRPYRKMESIKYQ